MKALLRVRALPNEEIITDVRHDKLNAFYGCLTYAPREKCLDCLKLLAANGCDTNPRDILKWKSVPELEEEGYFDVLDWLNISDDEGHRNTDLHMALLFCDLSRVQQILRANYKHSGLDISIQYYAHSCLLSCGIGIPQNFSTYGIVNEERESFLNMPRHCTRVRRIANLHKLNKKQMKEAQKQQELCLNLLLSYDLCLKESYFDSLITGVPPWMLFKLHAAGLPGLNKILPRISQFRLTLNDDETRQNNSSHYYPGLKDVKSMTYDEYTKYLWRKVFQYEKLREISDQHYASMVEAAPHTLQELCRQGARRCLKNNNEENLFLVVSKLSGPDLTRQILLYDQSIRKCTAFQKSNISGQSTEPIQPGLPGPSALSCNMKLRAMRTDGQKVTKPLSASARLARKAKRTLLAKNN